MLAGFGDSIMKGVMLRSAIKEGHPEYELSKRSIIDRCGELLGESVSNFARFGCTAPMGERLVERYESRLSEGETVLIGYGGNDSDYDWEAIADHPGDTHLPRTRMEDFVAAYHRIINRIRNAGAIPVMLSMPPMDADRYFRFFTRNMSDWHKKNILTWLGGNTALIVSGHKQYDMALYNIAQEEQVRILDIKSGFLSECAYDSYLCDDGIHPNEAGQARMSSFIVSQLRPVAA
ncbi:MAG: SGNH/GDSL hydrolase family protein [Paludibacteraceae bacterium]|nr:SGNH/GDSL hydrolase family protein [Paludibacteraceae bacterium]